MGIFNATDTYIFVPERITSDIGLVPRIANQFISRSQKQIRDLTVLSRQNIKNVDVRYSELEAEIIILKKKIIDISRRLKEIERDFGIVRKNLRKITKTMNGPIFRFFNKCQTLYKKLL